MRDVYQDMQAEHKGLDNWSIMRASPPKTGVRKWPEAWFYNDGKWSGPTDLPSLFEKHRLALIAAFSEPNRQAAWFAIEGDGQGRLWVAYNSRVLVVDRDGIKERECPATSDTANWFHLCRLPDGRMLLVQFSEQPKGHTNTLRALSVKDGKILVEDFPGPPRFVPSYQSTPLVAFVAKKKGIWLSGFQGTSYGYPQVWRFHDGQWEQRTDLGLFLLEEADGSLWFTPGGTGKMVASENRGYKVVKGDETSTFKCPVVGRLTPTSDGRLVAACNLWFVILGKAEEPLKRTITRLQISDRLAGRWA